MLYQIKYNIICMRSICIIYDILNIMLQTLFVAWEAGCLEKNYLRRWLSDTSHELERLEQDAAPPGWLCQWDRYSIPSKICVFHINKHKSYHTKYRVCYTRHYSKNLQVM